jgi:hypothetical protein
MALRFLSIHKINKLEGVVALVAGVERTRGRRRKVGERSSTTRATK